MSILSQQPPQIHRWTRDDYQKMGEVGIFDSMTRVELIEGNIIEMSPQNSQHSAVLTQTDRILSHVFGDGYTIRIQCPLALGAFSEPEPDVAVVQGAPFDYLDDHPSTALLVVEVSDSSLNYDRTTKASLYAGAGIQDYWVLNLIDHQLEVYRRPKPMEDQEFGYGYANRTIYTGDDTVTPVAGQGSVKVEDLLP